MEAKGNNENMKVDEENLASNNKRKKLENVADGNGVEYLGEPKASLKDKNQYRLIRLANGLVALLIEMPGDPLDLDQSAECTDYDSIIQESNRASFSLCINVGPFSDPWDVPRLSETTANMIANSIRGEIKLSNYSQSMRCDETIFLFHEIDHDILSRELDHFAQLLIGPLKSMDTLKNVRASIARKNPYGDFNEVGLQNRFLPNIARPDHPVSKLSDKAFKKFHLLTDDKLLEEIDKFQKRHYSAHRMTLYVKARLSLDEIEDLVKKCFSKIPNNGLPPDDFSQFSDINPFDPEKYHRIYKMKSIVFPELHLSWLMPSLNQHYRTKPLSYLSSLINRHDPGSLLHHLKRAKLCTGIRTNVSKFRQSSITNNSIYSQYKITLVLTKKGLSDVKQILDTVYSYINLIRQTGPQSSYFNELQNLQEMKFRLAKGDIKMTYDEVWLNYPPALMLTGEHLYFEYNPEAIQKCLDRWTPDKMNVLIMIDRESILMKDETYEEWYENNGAGEEIAKDWIDLWRTVEPLPEFHYPYQNIFVPNDLTVISVTENQPRFPVKIHSDKSMEVWWKPCTQTQLYPETYLNCHWISPLPFASAANTAMLRLLCKILIEFLADHMTNAQEAGYSYTINWNYKGIWVETNGPSQNLHFLLENIVEHIAKCPSWVTEEMFNNGKKEHFNANHFYMYGRKLANAVIKSVQYKVYWTMIDMLEAIRNVDYHQFRDFMEQYVKCLHTRYLVQGNITSDDAVKNAKCVSRILNYKPLLSDTIPKLEEIVIPLGVRCCRVRSSGSPHHIMNLYQFSDSSFKLSAMLEFFRIIAEPETEDTSRWDNIYGLYGSNFGKNSYTLHASGTRHDDKVYRIEKRIEKFRRELRVRFATQLEDEISETKEEMMKNKEKQCTNKNLLDEVQYNWKQITWGDCSFDRRQRELELIREMSSAEFRGWLLKFTMPINDGHIRKISVQVVDQDTSADCQFPQNDRPQYRHLEFVPISQREKNVSQPIGECITDIPTFKRNRDVI